MLRTLANHLDASFSSFLYGTIESIAISKGLCFERLEITDKGWVVYDAKDETLGILRFRKGNWFFQPKG